MTRGAIEAQKLLDELGWAYPGDLSIDEMAWSCGLNIQSKEMDGSDGRIVLNDDGGIICINSAIQYQPKINYIIAHEIGHARMHRGLTFFSENDRTLNEWLAKGQHEKEANDFAASLLMPYAPFSRFVKSKKLNLKLIEQAAELFGASKTATFLRYREIGEFPVMIIFIENGKIKWRSHSTDFPYTWLELNSDVPPWTVAGEFYHKQKMESYPEEVSAIEWFPNDFKLKGNESETLWEQCFPVTKNSIVTCLWTR